MAHPEVALADLRESRRTKIARRFTIFMAFLLLTCALLGVLYLVIKVRETQLDNRTTLTTTKSTSQQIKDCTQPGGDCFDKAQKRTAEVVEQILSEVTTTRHVSILASACATDPALQDLTRLARINAIDRCVNRALAAEENQ